METESGFAPVSGGQLYWEVAGQGVPLVLVHAGVADHRMWDAQWPEFAARYRVIRYDLRTFGRSSDSDAPFSHHQDLHALLAYLGVKRAHVVALSLGGRCALDFALAYPAQVAGLVLAACNPGGHPPSPVLAQTWAQVDALADQGRLEEANELEVCLWVDGPRRGPGVVDPGAREQVSRWNLATFTRAQPAVPPAELDPPAHARLHTVRAPTLVLVGDVDVPDVLAGSDRLAGGIPGARRVVVPGVAHMINMERPAEFNRLTLDFLAGVS